MMWPRPCRRMMGSAAWVAPSTATTFSSIRARSSSAVVCSSVAEKPRPALLTSTSSRPQRAATSSTIAAHRESIRHVHRVRGGLAPLRGQLGRELLQPILPARAQRHAQPGAREGARGRRPDPRRCPRDERDAPAGVSHAAATDHAGDLVAVARHPGVETGGEQLHAGQAEGLRQPPPAAQPPEDLGDAASPRARGRPAG